MVSVLRCLCLLANDSSHSCIMYTIYTSSAVYMYWLTVIILIDDDDVAGLASAKCCYYALQYTDYSDVRS